MALRNLQQDKFFENRKPVRRLQLSAWARFKIKASYSRAPIQNIIASVLSGQYAYSNGLESITQATNAFNAGLVGLAPQNGDNPNAPSAYLNYILFDSLYARKAAGAVQVPQAAGFEEPQRGSGYTNNNLLKFGNDIQVSQTGYLYIWVSNESENTEVWFDDLNVIHQKTLVAETTDYGVWGDVMREQKWEDLDTKYRYGYQGKYSEKDDETGWSHFELREYDDITGRWFQTDPEAQYYSPYIGMGNDPVNGIDEDGGKKVWYSVDGRWENTSHNTFFHNLFYGTQKFVGGKRVSDDFFWGVTQTLNPRPWTGELSAYVPNLWAQNKETIDNSHAIWRIPGQYVYGVMDNTYVMLQRVKDRYHLDGFAVTNSEGQEALVGMLSLGFGKSGPSTKVLSASQFSSKFKGTSILAGPKKEVGLRMQSYNNAARAHKSSKQALRVAKGFKSVAKKISGNDYKE